MADIDNLYWEKLLEKAIDEGVSDIHVAAGCSPFFRKHGKLIKQSEEILDNKTMGVLFNIFTSERERNLFSEQKNIDIARVYKSQRFRINFFEQNNGLAMAMRVIPMNIPSFDSLGLPSALKDLMEKENGLILVTGRTGAGKSTTIASLVDHVNKSRSLNIITLEDPVEYVYEPSLSMICQREYGKNFLSFDDALRSAVREDPDIIVVGEMRDAETVVTALNAAETGHLVLATLHTKTAAESVLRIESFFPAVKAEQVRAQLSIVLQAIISQQLLPCTKGGRVCASEVLVANQAVRHLIKLGKTQQLNSTMMTGGAIGMHTMSQSIEALWKKRLIDDKTAEKYIDKI